MKFSIYFDLKAKMPRSKINITLECMLFPPPPFFLQRHIRRVGKYWIVTRCSYARIEARMLWGMKGHEMTLGTVKASKEDSDVRSSWKLNEVLRNRVRRGGGEFQAKLWVYKNPTSGATPHTSPSGRDCYDRTMWVRFSRLPSFHASHTHLPKHLAANIRGWIMQKFKMSKFYYNYTSDIGNSVQQRLIDFSGGIYRYFQKKIQLA